MIATQQTRNAQNRHWLQALAEEFSGGRAALQADDARRLRALAAE